MKYKAVISDVDGTLLPPSEHPTPRLPLKLEETIIRVREKGIYFSMATGRSLEWMDEIVKGLGLTEPIILDNGARIYDCGKKKYVWESLIAKKDAEKVFAILKKDPSLNLFILDNGRRCNSVSDIREWKISKILVLGITPEYSKLLHKELEQLPNLSVSRSVSGDSPRRESIHVTNATATKQYGVFEVAKLLKISPKEIIGIGDSYNDFPLLLACGLKVAMGNAVPEIKEIADYIAPGYEENGVIHVLEKFVLRYTSRK